MYNSLDHCSVVSVCTVSSGYWVSAKNHLYAGSHNWQDGVVDHLSSLSFKSLNCFSIASVITVSCPEISLSILYSMSLISSVFRCFAWFLLTLRRLLKRNFLSPGSYVLLALMSQWVFLGHPFVVASPINYSILWSPHPGTPCFLPCRSVTTLRLPYFW